MLPLNFRFKQPGAAMMMALSAAFPFTAWAANAGRADFAVGDVRAISADGRSRPLTKGAMFDTGETIETREGRAQLRFTDGAQVSLQPGSQFRIDDYNFSGKVDGSEKGLFSLFKGGLRTITGLVGRTNRENYRVTTAVATIGIRGTEYSVQYGNSITVTTGEGIIEICNAAGCLILNSGETAYVADVNAQPVMTEKKADVPPPPPESQTLLGASRTEDDPVAFGVYPTPASEINALTGTVNYSLLSWTEPTSTISPIGTIVSNSPSNLLTANFTTKDVGFTLITSGPGSITGSGGVISGSSFSGTSMNFSGSGGTGSFSGTFLGSNAAQATLTYSGFEGSFGNVSGSAVFGR